MRALLYLELRQLVNSIRNTTRSPKRLIPMLIMAAWIFSWLLQNILFLTGTPVPQPSGPNVNEAIRQLPIEMIHAGVFLLLSFGSMVVVFQGFSSGLLIFSIAHIDFLFPTPVSRRKVLAVKLLKDYLKYGMWTAFFFLFVGLPALGSLNVSFWPSGLCGIAGVTALLLLVVNVAHTINLVFTFGFERLRQAGAVIKSVLVAALASAVIFGLYQYSATGDSYASILWAADSPFVKFVFAPAQWCSTLILAPIVGVVREDLAHLGYLWLLAVGSFVLLMSRKENVYEPSLGISVKFAKRRQAIRSGDYAGIRMDEMLERGATSPTGFSIPPFGRGAVALVWKNVLSKFRVSRSQFAVMIVLPALVVFLIRRFIDEPPVLSNLPFLLLYMAYVLSMMAQQEVRSELKYANILKPMPIAGWKVMLVQSLTASLYLGAGVLAFGASMRLLAPETRSELLVLCIVTAPFLGFATISTTMIPSLLYPDARDSAQNYICNMVGFLLISIATIPTIVLGIVLLAVAEVPYLYAVALICAANVIVGAAAVSISGSLFRRFDPTSE